MLINSLLLNYNIIEMCYWLPAVQDQLHWQLQHGELKFSLQLAF